MDSVTIRAEKAAQILGVQVTDIVKVLDDAGISDTAVGLEILNSPTTTIEDLSSILLKVSDKTIKDLPAKAAANVLKTKVEDKSEPSVINASAENKHTNISSDIVAIAQAIKPMQQWDDKSLLENFIETRSQESIDELDRRAKHQKFVVLKDPATKNLKKYEPGEEEIDLEMTLKLLRDTRKRVVPGVIPSKDGFTVVYRITELNIEDRIVELCPICGEATYLGYCSKCALNFSIIGEDEKAYVKLISETETFKKDVYSDRKAVFASASKGLADLKITWPSLIQKFEELKLTGNLPKLKIIGSRPDKVQDPFRHIK